MLQDEGRICVLGWPDHRVHYFSNLLLTFTTIITKKQK